LRNGVFAGSGEPLVKLDGVAAYVGVDATRHLAAALLLEDPRAILEGGYLLLCGHMRMDAGRSAAGA
jgi:hypothetical protein